jgi:hypothetical protein
MAQRSGIVEVVVVVWCTLCRCGAVRTVSASSRASRAISASTAAYSSSSAIEYDSVGSRVNGWGTTYGWWLVQ